MFYHRKKFLDEFKMRFQKILIKDCRRLPIHRVVAKDKNGVDLHDQIVESVKAMMQLQVKLGSAHVEQDRSVLERQIESTGNRIDKLVYALYGLTEQEIGAIGHRLPKPRGRQVLLWL